MQWYEGYGLRLVTSAEFQEKRGSNQGLAGFQIEFKTFGPQKVKNGTGDKSGTYPVARNHQTFRILT